MSPPVKGGDPPVLLPGQVGFRISILTPARGVTCPQKRTAIHAAISILTPAKGVTPSFQRQQLQLRISILTPARGVTEMVTGRLSTLAISILTPAKRVTCGCQAQRRPAAKFQFPPPRGGVTCKGFTKASGTSFQFSPPVKGVTRPWRRWAPASGNFNSHPREGGD